MSSKKWLVMFVFCLLLLPVFLMGFNYAVDPFGVFGNMKWYSFSETLNPRVAKTEYLIENGKEYDSFLVGCSSTSGYPVELLNKYLDASFYNTFSYGADMKDAEQTVKWLLENYKVKNIFLNVYIHNGVEYDVGEDKLTSMMHYKMSESNKFDFYKKYLFAHPNYAIDKLKSKFFDKWETQSFDVFDEYTGAYDKKMRDVEKISDINSYLENYPVFKDYPVYSEKMENIDGCMQSVKNIVDMCENAGVNLIVVNSPVYSEYFKSYSKDDITNFYREFAKITSFWDFSYTPLSYDPRYFYDATHFRNDVGRMAVSKIFGDENVYFPENFGRFITSENVDSLIQDILNQTLGFNDESYTKQIPILLYHHITDGVSNSDMEVTVEKFEEHIKALYENGYTAITFDELYEYVENGKELPQKPVMINFDDGYKSNYEFAYPILKKYNMKATIFVIGVSIGKDTYKDTGKEITPHFDMKQAQEMQNSGIIDIQSHTFDMHQVENLDKSPARVGAVPLKGESEADYINAFKSDIIKNRDIINSLGKNKNVLAYPYGFYTQVSEALCKSELSIKATVTTNPVKNTVIKGLLQSLYAMGRYGVTNDMNADFIINMIEENKQ